MITIKRSLYARAGIPVYWIINVVDRRLEVYRADAPERSEGERRQILGELDAAELVLDGQPVGRIAVAELLP